MNLPQQKILCSTIIPTVSRSTLKRAVESVLQQNLSTGEFEVLVINDSGSPLAEDTWQHSQRVQVINTRRRERSIARNTGAAMARGQYLHFLDDDDWLAPGAYLHLLELSQSTQAKWLYGITELVDRKNNSLIRLRHGLHGNCFVQTMAGEWIPLQSSWIERKTFLRIGGFNPLLTGPEDIDLLRRVLMEEDAVETPDLISHITMGIEGSTTDYARHAQASRFAREAILDGGNARHRMSQSATDPFWKGRMLRIYLTSVAWNVAHRRLLTAASRTLFSVLSFFLAGRNIFSKRFWLAVSQPYASLTFENGIQEARSAK
jgi:glycosyltransferase involved in cell wall biosynthesis